MIHLGNGGIVTFPTGRQLSGVKNVLSKRVRTNHKTSVTQNHLLEGLIFYGKKIDR